MIKKMTLVLSMAFTLLIIQSSLAQTDSLDFTSNEQNLLLTQEDNLFYYSFEEKIALYPVENKYTIEFIDSVDESILEAHNFNPIKVSQKIYEVEGSRDEIKSVGEGIYNLNPVYTIEDGLTMRMKNAVVLQWNKDVSENQRAYLSSFYGLTETKTTRLFNVYQVTNPLSISQMIYETGTVRYCHPVFLSEVEVHDHIPNDEYFGNQFYLHNTGQECNDGNFGTADADIDAPAAWDISLGSSDIVIAVLDEGVTSDHPDLPNSRQIRLPGSNFAAQYNPTGGDPNNPSPIDSLNEYHGNACAGIIAAEMDNEQGVVGIAPNCKIMPVRIPQGTLHYDLPTYNDYAQSLTFAVDNGADIISCSWGFGSTNPNLSPPIIDAIEDAITQGVVVLFSASNTANHINGDDGVVRFPACANIDELISVGASDRNDQQANYSPSNSKINISAPSHTAYSSVISSEGGNIWTIDNPDVFGKNPTSSGELLPSSGTNYLAYTGRMGGTSSSTPMVAGVVALMLSVNPDLTIEQVLDILYTTAEQVGGYDYQWNAELPGHSKELGHGRLNAFLALESTLQTPTASAGSDTTLCDTAEDYTLMAQGVDSNVSFQWEYPDGTLGLENENITISQTVSNSGVYTLHYYNEAFPLPYTDQVTLNIINSEMDLALSYSGVCFGSMGQVNTQLLGDYTYQWSSDWSAFVNPGDTSAYHFESTESFDITLSATHNQCSFEIIDSLSVLFINEYYDWTLGEDETICLGDSITLGVPEQEGYTYLWESLFTDFPTSLESQLTYAPTLSNGVVLHMLGEECGSQMSDTVLVHLMDETYDLDLSEDLTVCFGDAVQLAQNLDLPDFVTYHWLGSNGEETFVGNPVIYPQDDITYTLYTSTPYCQVQATDHIEITVVNENAPMVLYPYTSPLCYGSSKLIGTPSLTGFSYSWTSTDPDFNPSNHTTNVISVGPEQSATYYLTRQDTTCGGTSTTDSIFVEVINESISVNLESELTLCSNQIFVYELDQVLEDYTYLWYNDLNSPTIDFGDQLIVLPPQSPETYYLKVHGPNCSDVFLDSIVVSVEDISCNCGEYYHYPELPISSNQTWTVDNLPINNNTTAPQGVIRIENSLTISDNSTLTLSPGVTLEMGTNAVITVEQGAELVLNGATITNACDAWQGVQVIGTTSWAAIPTNQSGLVMKNGAKIEGATVGALVIGNQGDYIHASNSSFVNCGAGAMFFNFIYISSNGEPLDNSSYFKNCEFTFDPQVNELHADLSELYGLSIIQVDGIEIEGCDFILNLPGGSSPHKRHNGAAIGSFNSRFEMDARSTQPTYPPSYDDRNYISGFEYGVYVSNSDLLSPVRVDRSDFHNNRVGVRLNNSAFSSVTRNSFEIPTMRDDIKILSAGLYLNESNHYQVEENTFEGISPLRGTASGIVVKNSGNNYNRLYRNDISRLDFGIGVYGDNGFLSQLKYSGLHIDCNDFGEYSSIAGAGNNNNRNDIYLNANAYIDETQGSGNAPAGNRFSDYPINGNDGNYSVNNLYYDSEALIYYHNEQDIDNNTIPDPATDDRLSLLDLDLEYIEETTCPPNIRTGPIRFEPEMLIIRDEKLQERDLLVDNYKSILNGGIKPEIMSVLLDNFASTSEVHAKLAQGSPYLTDDVLIAAITREIPLNQWDLAQILMVNGKLSRKVLHVFNQVQPLTPFLANLVLSVDGYSMRYLLEMGIENKNIEVAELEKQYMYSALFDSSIVTPYGQIVSLYENPVDLQQLQITVSALLKQQEVNLAQQKLDDYLAQNPDSSLEFMQMQIDLAIEGMSWEQLNEAQMNSLNQIAFNAESSEQSKALAVLDMVNNNPLPEFEMPVTYAPEARLAQQQSYTVLPRDLMSISPNPSDGEVYVTYELPNEFSSAQLIMHNTLGQQVVTWDITSHPQFFKLNCENYTTGVYSVSLMVDGKKIETQKLTLMTD